MTGVSRNRRVTMGNLPVGSPLAKACAGGVTVVTMTERTCKHGSAGELKALTKSARSLVRSARSLQILLQLRRSSALHVMEAISSAGERLLCKGDRPGCDPTTPHHLCVVVKMPESHLQGFFSGSLLFNLDQAKLMLNNEKFVENGVSRLQLGKVSSGWELND